MDVKAELTLNQMLQHLGIDNDHKSTKCFSVITYSPLPQFLVSFLCLQDSEMSALQELSLVLEKLEKVTIVLQRAGNDSPTPLSHSKSKPHSQPPDRQAD